ncbi:MAG: hypothetical protein LBP43_05280 [Treponema sp.]|nr:hypothetical protein [Treponema sp.]
MKGAVLFLGFCFLFSLAPAAAEDDFGFGFSGEEDGAAGSSVVGSSVKIGGKVQAEFLGYVDAFNSFSQLKNMKPGNVFSGKLNFSASGSAADGVVNLNLAPDFEKGASPLSIDEAYVRAYFGPLSVEGGLRKLTWGKADSFGPLDVINPLDYSDLSGISAPRNLKIPRPMIRVSYGFGSFTKAEALFVPWFWGHRFAGSGSRWAPAEVRDLPQTIQAALVPVILNLPAPYDPLQVQQKIREVLNQETLETLYADDPALLTLGYAQGGLRLTTTLGVSDLGFQYFYGNLPRPALNLKGIAAFLGEPRGFIDGNKYETLRPEINYNRYHQIGVDYARVIGGFNLRLELAANITGDLSGDQGDVYNPFLAWSAGFDRDLTGGIAMNLQVNESIRLFQNKIGKTVFTDIEAGKDRTSTRLTLILSKKLLRDELELKASVLWGIEDRDFYLIPALIWTREDVGVELSGGFFGGDKKGELGQYRDNGFIKVLLSYSF